MSEFLEQRHASYTTQPTEIAALMQGVTQRPISEQRKIMRGYDNEVYAVTTTDGERFIVRIRRHGGMHAEDEAWAIEAARAAGAPVPAVLLCEPHWIDGAAREVMIQRALPGKPLADRIAALDGSALRHCYVQVAAALRKIHSVAVDGFYMRHRGVWDFPDWASIAAANLRDRAAERPALLQVGFSEAECDRLLMTLASLQSRFPCPQPVLLHADYTPEHWLFDDELKLTGIIDFGQSQGGSPIVDLDSMLNNQQIQLEWLHEGYGSSDIWNDFNDRRLVQSISLVVGSLNHHVMIGDMAEVETLTTRLRAVLDQIT